jgi:hypothetical protein
MGAILRWIIPAMALATWNPFKYLIGTDEVEAKVQEEYNSTDWFKIIVLILLPLILVFFVLRWLGVFSMFSKKKTYKRRRPIIQRIRSAVRPASAKTAMQRKMARLRALRKKKSNSRKK